ncbi:MAG: methyltransferase domain-containing protein [Candidatus Helarchaeota archaeon]|nr:methyltransferase domain-containing protein [Candidatus Helarchaeota archaeon]
MDVVEKTIQTYNKIAPKYCKITRISKFIEWEIKYVCKLISYISKPMPLILDIGCGDGRHCKIIEENGGKAIGIDLSESMLKEAKKYYPKGNFQLIDMRKLNFDNDFFDGIWISGCIYHIPKSELNKLIEEFKRVLKLNGVISLNFKLGTGEGMEENPKSYPGSPRYFAYYSNKEIMNTFNKFGFEELESTPFPEEIFGDRIQQMWFRLKNK